MLDFADLATLAVLVELGELDQAKEIAARVLDTAEIDELDTIMGTADILDSHADRPVVGMARLKAYTRELPDDHHRALAAFCAAYTGDRADVADAPTNYEPLSVYQDHRPGYDPHDAQPLGLTVTAEPGEDTAVWKARRAAAQLPRNLRDDIEQLPRDIQDALASTEVRAIPNSFRRDRGQCRRTAALNAAEARADQWFHFAYGLTRLGVHETGTGTTGRTRAAGRAVRQVCTQGEPAPRTGKDYTRVWLGVRDIDKTDPDTPNTDPTGFDLYPTGHDEDPDQRPVSVTPCVSCWVERSVMDARRAADDGLCTECRDANRPGLDQTAVTGVTLPAYLSRRSRSRAAEVTADTARVAAQIPTAAAMQWIRAAYRMAAGADRELITLWVQRWNPTTTETGRPRRHQYRPGQALPSNTVYVGRPSPFGNPFKCEPTSTDRARAVSQYREWITTQPALIAKARAELTGRTLACYCPVDGPCHADVLLEIIDTATPARPLAATA